MGINQNVIRGTAPLGGRSENNYAKTNRKLISDYYTEERQQKLHNDIALKQRKNEQLTAKLREEFHPTAVEWLKKYLDLDVYKLDKNNLYAILHGHMTTPLVVHVDSVGYDYEKKTSIDGKRLEIEACFMFKFPTHKENGKSVMSSLEGRVPYVASYPAYPHVAKEQRKKINEEPKGEREIIPFSDAEMTALSRIGVARQSFYYGNGFTLDNETRKLIKAGEHFPFKGNVVVNTPNGSFSLNTYGEGQIVCDKGEYLTLFETTYSNSDKRHSGGLDLYNIRRNGYVDIDVFEKKGNGKGLKLDIYGFPIPNKAAEQLQTFGYALEPMTGFEHHYSIDPRTGEQVDKIEASKYQVSCVNGGLYAIKMNDQQIPEVRLNNDDCVVIINGSNRQVLEFEDGDQLESYLAGKGGFVKKATWLDFGSVEKGKSDKPEAVVYRAFVLADNQRCGFAKLFSPLQSEKIARMREQPQSQTVRKTSGRGL